MPSRLKIFFDGGCRPNPGAMEIAVVAGGHAYVRRDLGYGTSEDAEWLALIAALRVAQMLGTTEFVLLGDAAAIVGVAEGRMKCRGGAVRHWQDFRSMVQSPSPPRIRFIRRSQNLAGIALARLHPR
jgi:ribonuclease HI